MNQVAELKLYVKDKFISNHSLDSFIQSLDYLKFLFFFIFLLFLVLRPYFIQIWGVDCLFNYKMRFSSVHASAPLWPPYWNLYL